MNKTYRKGAELSDNRKAALRFLSLYFFFLTGITGLYTIYIPYLMDYYIARPEQFYFSFFLENVTKTPYAFEGIIIGMVLALFYCLTIRVGVSTLIVSVFLFLLTHASYIKYINRRELLRLDDLRLTEAAGMAIGYLKFTPDRWLVLFAGGLLLFVGAGFVLDSIGRRIRKDWILYQPEQDSFGKETGPDRASDKLRLILPCVRLFIVFVLCAAICFYMDYFLREGSVLDEVEPMTSQNDMYVLYRFLQNDRFSMIGMERVDERYDFLLSQEPQKEAVEWEAYPNVIVIMNESWWNTDNIQSDRIVFSRDPMGPYKELADRCGTGYVTANVFGGGTVSSEVEFLTGLNTKYFRAESIYAQMQGRKIPSLVDYFNDLDYDTVAIHPYYDYFYDRDEAYAAMGFDKAIFEDDMQYKDIYTRYISDESLAKEIIARMQESSTPKFIWAVSMANHIRVLDYEAEVKISGEYPVPIFRKRSCASQGKACIICRRR